MADKKKPAKKADKPKKKEAPNKEKARKPSKVYRSAKERYESKVESRLVRKTSIELDEIAHRRLVRVQGVVRAAGILKSLGYMVERGNSLVIVPRLKLILAFDSQDLDESLQKEAAVSKYKLVHILPSVFKSKRDLTTFLTDAVDVLKDQEVKPKRIRRSKKLSKALDTDSSLR